MKSSWIRLAMLACAIALGASQAVTAAPVRYTFQYESDGCADCVPGFSFSFEMPDYVTTTGTFALPVPFVAPTGAPGDNTIARAGTAIWGIWLFGKSGLSVNDLSAGLSFFDGPGFAFEPLPSMTTYITAPGTYAFQKVTGETQSVPGSLRFLGKGTLTVTELPATPVPEPTTLALFGTGLAGMLARRVRRTPRGLRGTRAFSRARVTDRARGLGRVICLSLLLWPVLSPSSAYAMWLGLDDGDYALSLKCDLSTVITCPSTIEGTLTVAGIGLTALDVTVDGQHFLGNPVDGTFNSPPWAYQDSLLFLLPFRFVALRLMTAGELSGYGAGERWWTYCHNAGDSCMLLTTGTWTATELPASPVPEPASLTLFGLGLAGVAGRRLRRK